MPRTVPALATPVPSNFLTAALWVANVKALGDFTLGPPKFSAYAATTQSLADNTWTALSLDTEVMDSDAGHSTVTNTSRYVCQVAGTYLVTGVYSCAANATGNRAVRLAVNGTAVTGSFVKTLAATASHSSAVCTARLVPLAVNDYVEVMGNQSSGGALSTSSGTDVACSMSAVWMST